MRPRIPMPLDAAVEARLTEEALEMRSIRRDGPFELTLLVSKPFTKPPEFFTIVARTQRVSLRQNPDVLADVLYDDFCAKLSDYLMKDANK